VNSGLLRILVLTLYSGEQEFDRCRASVAAQKPGPIEHRAIKNLPNHEAHRLLYTTITEEREVFDVFVKLDADMVLAQDGTLAKIAHQFRSTADLDHLVLGIADWYTGADIIGLHAFSGRVSWQKNDDQLFVDPDPAFPGRKLVVPHPNPEVAFHSPDPSPFQAFQFGVHRAMKACQRNIARPDAQPHSARVQWSYLNRVWRNLERHGDRRLALAVLGADLVFSGLTPDDAGDRRDPATRAAYESVEAFETGAILNRLEPHWRSPARRFRRWMTAMDRSMVALVAVRLLRDAATWPIRSLKRVRQRRASGDWTGRRVQSGGTAQGR
jgi:hypothetical protein